jgi:hypothetical protein
MKTMKEYISTAEGMMQMWEKVNEVLDGFNFNNVATVMEALDWYWVCTENEEKEYADAGCTTKWSGEGSMYEYRPEYPQLLAAARKHIIEAIKGMPDDEKHWSVVSGGFKVEIWISTDEERADYWGAEIANVDDFSHSVDIGLYFIAEEYTTI